MIRILFLLYLFIIQINAIGYYCPTPSFTLIPSSNYGTLKKMIILTRHGDRENIVRLLNESICYDENICDSLMHGKYDRPVGLIVTEKRIIDLL